MTSWNIKQLLNVLLDVADIDNSGVKCSVAHWTDMVSATHR